MNKIYKLYNQWKRVGEEQQKDETNAHIEKMWRGEN